LLPFLTYATTVGDEQQVASNVFRRRTANDVFRRRTAATNGRPRIPATNGGDERPATACMRAARDSRLAGRAQAIDQRWLGQQRFFLYGLSVLLLLLLGSSVGLVFYRRPARDVSGAECAHVLLIVGRNVRVVGLDILA
jgi:hypothetical protein